jgi:hypothetical protein
MNETDAALNVGDAKGGWNWRKEEDGRKRVYEG